jgi:hypothetical protein
MIPSWCRKKKRYTDLPTARRQATKAWLVDGKRLWPYHCDDCGNWHLTSMTIEEQLKNGYSPVLK